MLRCFCLVIALSSAVPAFAVEPLTPADRILWTESKVVGSPEPPTPYQTKQVFEQLKLAQPIYLVAEPGTNNYFVVEHVGGGSGPASIKRFVNSPEVTEIETVLSFDELIYAVCLHPQFVENGYLFVMANGPDPAADEEAKKKHRFNRIVRYTMNRQAPQAVDPATRFVILEWESNGHNGGELGFGPDGLLYCPTGDGTSDSDTLQTGQGVDDLLAVLLRIDVDHPEPGKNYSIPKDNPFVDQPGARPEIWAFGFRNPWRMTFDKQTGGLWVCQNGQDLWEQA
jgi:glucose/arabinose dehydrogenase